MKDLQSLIKVRDFFDYQIDNFEKFLKHEKFSFDLPAVHIAGTNGKGTTANYIANIYRSSGYRVGLFSSPYFYEINEMISVNGENIDDQSLKDYISEYKKPFEKYNLSSFEMMTFIAYSYFIKQKCDIVVIECGMGGSEDATNIITPVLSIITSVSLEHTNFLGKTLSEIALAKSGIIKPDVPVLINDFKEEIVHVISRTARENDAPINMISLPNNVSYALDGITFDYLTYQSLKISSIAFYSIEDASFAISAVQILQDKFPVDEKAIKEGLLITKMNGRMSVISTQPLIIVDGAHNPEAIDKLAESLSKLNIPKIHTIFACFKDKNFPQMLNTVGGFSEKVVLTTFAHPRARGVEDYFLFASEYQFYDDYHQAIDEMKKDFDGAIVITGSLAFAAEVIKNYH